MSIIRQNTVASLPVLRFEVEVGENSGVHDDSGIIVPMIAPKVFVRHFGENEAMEVQSVPVDERKV